MKALKTTEAVGRSEQKCPRCKRAVQIHGLFFDCEDCRLIGLRDDYTDELAALFREVDRLVVAPNEKLSDSAEETAQPITP